MSGSKKKQLKFKEVGASNGKNDIPETNDPMAIAMAGGKDGADRTQAEFQKTPIRDRTATDEQYPTADLTAEDPRDAVMQAKMELQDPAKPGITPFGQLVAKDSDFKWLQKKRDQEAEANFQVSHLCNSKLHGGCSPQRQRSLARHNLSRRRLAPAPSHIMWSRIRHVPW